MALLSLCLFFLWCTGSPTTSWVSRPSTSRTGRNTVPRLASSAAPASVGPSLPVLPTPGRIFQPGWLKQAAAVKRKEDLIKAVSCIWQDWFSPFLVGKKCSASEVKTIKKHHKYLPFGRSFFRNKISILTEISASWQHWQCVSKDSLPTDTCRPVPRGPGWPGPESRHLLLCGHSQLPCLHRSRPCRQVKEVFEGRHCLSNFFYFSFIFEADLNG